MSVVAAAGEPPLPPGPPFVWRPVASGQAFACGHAHPAGGGGLDESDRRLSHAEYAVAQVLAREGHDVRSVAESRGAGRRPDLLVCGSGVEVKSFAPPLERRREPSPQSVFNKLADAAGQARHVVLVAGSSGLSAGTVRRGLARYAADQRPLPPLASVRALGDGFDVAWARRPGVERSRTPAAARSIPSLELGR